MKAAGLIETARKGAIAARFLVPQARIYLAGQSYFHISLLLSKDHAMRRKGSGNAQRN